MTAAAPLVLLVALVPGHGGMHLPRHLARHGFRVGFAGSPQAIVAKSGHLQACWEWSWDATPFSFDPFLRVVAREQPIEVVPLDELAVLRLEQVGGGVLPGSNRAFPAEAVRNLATIT